MIRGLAIASLLVGCAAEVPLPAEPSLADLRPRAGAPSNRIAGTVLSVDPPSVRLFDAPRSEPTGYLLVARDPITLRPTAELRVVSGRGAVLRVTCERGRMRHGDEVVEPSPTLLTEANKLPAP